MNWVTCSIAWSALLDSFADSAMLIRLLVCSLSHSRAGRKWNDLVLTQRPKQTDPYLHPSSRWQQWLFLPFVPILFILTFSFSQMCFSFSQMCSGIFIRGCVGPSVCPSVALWTGTNKNRVVSTGPLFRPLARTAHFAHFLVHGKVYDFVSQNDLDVSHSASVCTSIRPIWVGFLGNRISGLNFNKIALGTLNYTIRKRI